MDLGYSPGSAKDGAFPGPFWEVHMRATLGFIRIIRWLLIIKAVGISYRFSPRLSDLIGEVTGLNDALLSAVVGG